MTPPDSQSALGGDISADQSTTTISISSPPPSSTLRQHQQPQSSPSGSNSSNDGSIEANNNNTVGQLAPLIKMANSDEHRKLQVQHQQKQKQQQVADGDMTSAAAPAQVQVEIKAQISSGGTAQIEAATPNDNPESLGHTIIECDPAPAAAAGGGGANERNGQPPVLAAEDVAVVSVAAAAPGQDSLHRSISVDVARDEEQQEQAPELSVVSVELTSANRQEQQQVQHKSNDEDVDELKSRRENKQEDTLSAGPDGSESEGAIKREETNNLRNQQQTLVAVATTAQDPTTLNNNKSISITSNNNNNNKQSQHPPPPIKPICVSADHPARPYCKRRRLSYLQSLLLRKWPYLALAICTMSSLLFGMLLSALTVYMMHGVTNCSAAMAAVAAAAGAPSYAGSAAALEPRNRLPEFDTPLELASLEAVAAGGRQYAALSAPVAPASAGGGGSGDQQLVQKQGEQKPHFQRLPSSLWPQHYDLFIQPYIAEPFNFTGKVSIRILCKEPTDRISLHANDLQIDESKLRLEQVPKVNASSSSGGNTVPKVKGLSQDKQLQYAIVELDRELEVGVEYVIGIDFAGTLNDDLAGFYKIRYERPNSNETTWIAATQFQATDARRAFPCFDEPSYKATFSIQIKHWKNMTALSNMPIIDRQDSQDGLWVTDTFSKSQRMSTYLVAYAITNFESRSEGNISVWTRPGFAHTAEYALKIAGKILRHYEDFFGIEYPLPKMDMIALPDFNAGAMENWGLITYRETAMLFDESSSSIANKQRVAVVVAHELAHQWFGNLVTPKWWDDLWLNEGFASYVEYIGVDHVEPQWRMLDQFVVEEVQNVFRMDALSSSHQISIPVNNPDEISEIFDHISYAKGASIIRMMNHFLTEQVFKAGLRKYLRALKYSNAEQSDLWSHLSEVAAQIGPKENGVTPVDVERVMNSWTLQTGFPLVTLTREYGAEGKSQARAHLEQVRYQPYKSSQPANNSSVRSANTSVSLASSKPTQKWEIPITLTWKSEQNWSPNTRLWMHQNDSGPVELAANQVPKSDDEWMLLNVNQVGYYRVNYDQQNWKLLIEQLQQDHKQISTTNRAQILDDLFELARSGVIDYRFAMEATKYLRVERDYLPWDTVLMSFSYIDDMLQRSAIYGDWKDYISDLTRPYYARYKDAEWTKKLPTSSGDNGLAGNASEMGKSDVLEHYNMVNAIAWACQVDNHCIQKAKSIFSEWKQSGKNEINPALRYTTYCTAIENGNKSDWDFLWRVYEKEQNASERDRIMRALGCSKEIWILSRYLEWTFSKTKQIRRQDGAFVFRMIAKNNYGRDIAFNFLHERWSTIKEFYGKTSFSMGNLVRSISTSMNTQVELNQLTTFYESIKHDVGTGKRSFQIAIEEVETNVLWRNRNYKILEEWLHSNMGKLPAMVAS